MIRNYLSLATRNFLKNPFQSFIKISGLAVGVAGCVVIFLIARYELSFDTFQPDKERIFRVYSQFSGLWEGTNRGVPIPLPQKIRNEFTGVEAVAAFQTYSATVTVEDSVGEKKKLESQQSLVLAGPDYFDVFTAYEWKFGSSRSLETPFSVVLTEGKALKYFGTSDPESVVGKKVVYRDSLETTVTGIVKDIEGRTDLAFTDFISTSTIDKSWLKESYDLDSWTSTNSSSQCFIKISPGTEIKSVEAQTSILVEERNKHDKNTETKVSYRLQPLPEMHFNPKIGIFDNGSSPANLSTLKTLVIIAVLLLIIAAINFINLETAQAIRRAKEVGLRKSMGSTRTSLVVHFLAESALLTSIAVLLALPLCYATFTFFVEFMPTGLKFVLFDPFLWMFIVVTIGLVSILSGLYPAVILSSYQPAVALRNQSGSGQSRSAALRKILTVFQFSFSQVLIVGTLIIGWQIKFMLDKELGFDKDAIISFNTPWWEKANKRQTLRNELDMLPEIVSISQHTRAPASTGWSSTTVKYQNGQEEILNTVHVKSGDTSYLRLFGLRLIAGRNVQPSDSIMEFLINETFCRKLNVVPEKMIGQTLKTGSDKVYTVVGVLKDFHFQSLHHAIEPLYFKHQANSGGFSVRLATRGETVENLDQSLEKITGALKKIYPDQKIDYTFFDATIEKFYQTEKRMAKLTNTATGLAIFISCLGLLGLASFTAVQRTKEIGIRKVLGASVNSIVALLSKEFLLLVLIAFVIAVPTALFLADKWLSDFAFRVEISIWIFILAGALSVLIAFLTVGFQALKAAITKPVDSLRYE